MSEESTFKEQAFGILNDSVWEHDAWYYKHLPEDEGWKVNHGLVFVNMGLGISQTIDKVYRYGKEVGAVLIWSNASDFSENGMVADAYEDYKEAVCSLAVEVVGEERLKRYLSD